MNIWRSKYYLGFALGFFISSYIKYSHHSNWKVVLGLAIVFNIFSLIPLLIILQPYLLKKSYY